ncbi:hypothetical protein SAMN05444157_3273 [Frankineae bacterium MT45]|nr:hypothetical protein SAMN05444157_3273 [Frankineae bacterium MT45]
MSQPPYDPNQPPYPPQAYPAQGYAPPPGYAPVPQPPSKKSHKVRNIILGVIGVFVLIMVIAAVANGGSKTTPDATTTTSGAPKSSAPSIAHELGSKDASGDVTLGKTSTDEIGYTHAAVTVTNHSSKRSNYIIELSLQSADGKTLYSSTTVPVENLEPGQASPQDAVFLTSTAVPAGAKVVIKSVDRLAA